MVVPALRIACFEPWLGGSHRSFLDEWAKRSQHQLDVFGLSPRHWKWRQEASAWELAKKIDPQSEPPDLLFCSDYVDLPRLIGFLPERWRQVRTLAYFHENQLTYPVANGGRNDHGPGFSNILTAIRADALVFNSNFHRAEFGAAADKLLKRLPSPNPRAELAAAIERASVIPPLPDLDGIPPGPGAPEGAPMRVLFPHRLEPDKDPAAFCHAVREAADAGAEIELVFTGTGRGTPRPEIAAALQSVAAWTASDSGYAESRESYIKLLRGSDVVASTAHHEFFGVAFAEAMAAGCTPLAPGRLSYPSLLEGWQGVAGLGGLYGPESGMVAHLLRLSEARSGLRQVAARDAARGAVIPFDAGTNVPALDALCDRTVTNLRHPQG